MRPGRHEVGQYLAAGTRRVWLVWPERGAVEVHQPGAEPESYRAGQIMTSEAAGFDVPGFALALTDLFAD